MSENESDTTMDFDWEIGGRSHASGLNGLPEPVRDTLDEELFATFYDANRDAVLLVSIDDVGPGDVAGAADSELETREAALSRAREALAAARQVPGAALDAGKAEDLSGAVDGLLSLERQLQNEVEQQRAAGEHHG